MWSTVQVVVDEKFCFFCSSVCAVRFGKRTRLAVHNAPKGGEAREKLAAFVFGVPNADIESTLQDMFVHVTET